MREIVVLVAVDIGVRPLKAENRLFIVTDHEQGALGILRPVAIEPWLGQRLDDLPLPGVGVLRFIDQHVIDALVELVAHPFGGAGGLEQPLCRCDHVVIIDNTQPRLGIHPACCQPNPNAQMAGGMRGDGIEPLFDDNRHHRLAKLAEQRPQRRIGLVGAGRHGAGFADVLVL